MKVVATFAVLVLTAGLCFCAKANLELRKQVADLDGKIAALAERPVAAPIVPANVPVAGTSTSTDSAESRTASVTDHVEPAHVATGDSIPVARKAASSDPIVGGPTVNPAGWTEADRTAFEKEVLAVMDKQQQERQDKQEARQSEWMSSRLKEQLKLTDQQAEQVGKVVAATTAQIKDLRQTITPENRDQVRPQIQSALQAADTQIKSYLTAEQAMAYDEVKKTSGGPGFGMGGGGGGKRGKMMGGDGSDSQ